MEDMEHPGIIVEYVSGELHDTAFPGDFKQLIEHGDCKTLALPVIPDDESNLSSVGRLVKRVTTDGNYHLVFVFLHHTGQGHFVHIVDIDEIFQFMVRHGLNFREEAVIPG